MSKRGNSGFLQGIIINLIVGGSSAIFVKWLTTTLLNPVAGILLAYITLVTSLIYFGRMGLRKIPVGFWRVRNIHRKTYRGTSILRGVGVELAQAVWRYPARRYAGKHTRYPDDGGVSK